MCKRFSTKTTIKRRFVNCTWKKRIPFTITFTNSFPRVCGNAQIWDATVVSTSNSRTLARSIFLFLHSSRTGNKQVVFNTKHNICLKFHNQNLPTIQRSKIRWSRWVHDLRKNMNYIYLVSFHRPHDKSQLQQIKIRHDKSYTSASYGICKSPIWKNALYDKKLEVLMLYL